MIFDYRCIHRGLPNANRERPVAYIVVATDGSTTDTCNFPQMSIDDVLPVHIDHIPFWDDYEYT